VFLASALWLAASFTSSKIAAASASEAAICDTADDHFLSIENYPETIRLHREVLKTQTKNSLVYYHLGFSYGMLDDQMNEIRAYRQAIALGLVRWDLFLNLIYAEQGDEAGAAAEWRDLLQVWPGYLPAPTNLAILNAAHMPDAPPREQQIEKAPIRDARPQYNSTVTGIRN
jgi:tetratricopeptide (TPR) repeat protein